MTDALQQARLATRAIDRASTYPRTNALNLIRLALAALVLVDHAYPIGGYGGDPAVGRISFGALAVFGFFGLSGFLITASGMRTGSWKFVRNRLVRIMPGYWLVLLLTAFVICPLASRLSPTAGEYTIGDLVSYVVNNLALIVRQPVIGDTLAHVPDTHSWNASLWTLPLEFGCYILVGVAAAIGLLRHPRVVTVLGGVLTAGLLVVMVSPAAADAVGAGPTQGAELLLMFTAGAVLRLWETRLRLRLVYAVAAVLVAGAGILVFAHPAAVVALPLTYTILYLGARLPSPALVRRNDISYGVYIFGMPVQQALALLGWRGGSALGFAGLAALVVIPLATASWRFVERPALARAKRSDDRKAVPR